ncbi:MAG TPA: WecB/TagA/CpsF family glycosyltransferase [Acidimicrobiales bacterium]|nr:WecB/TagA/CpsF family glycosyltransferase [Acidimicrobiales bacterium]
MDTLIPAAPRLDTPVPAPRHVRTRQVLGFDFVDDVSIDATVERLLAAQPVDGREPIVFTPNVDTVVHMGELERSGVAHRMCNSRYILPDGQPIVWASRLLGEPLSARLAGSDLVPPLWRRLVAEDRRAMVVVSCPEVAAPLQAEMPSLGVYVPPAFDVDDPAAFSEVVRDAAEVLDRTGPEFVFLGISFKKRELLALALIDHLRRRGRPPPLFLCIGGALELHVGRHRRAPRWVQRAGGEWFFRFLLEPRRLFRRYFMRDLRFLPIMRLELRAARELGLVRPLRRRLVGPGWLWMLIPLLSF